MSLWADIRFTLFLMAGGQQLLSQQTVKTRALCEQVFVVHLFTELAGLSALPVAGGLRLLPYTVPIILSWRRNASGPEQAWENAGCAVRC